MLNTQACELPVVLETLGHRFYSDFVLPLVYCGRPEIFDASAGAPRMGLWLLERGAATLHDHGVQRRIVAPVLLVLDEAARPCVELADGAAGASLFFHPSVVNSAFAAGVLPREGASDLALTAVQDLYLFEPFLAGGGRAVVVELRPGHADRLSTCFGQIGYLLAQQPHQYWPCLTRSFLIEVLFMLRLIFQEERAPGQLPAVDPRLERALALLHERFDEPLRLDDVARHCATNRTTLNGLLRARTGMPMRAYLVALRMRMAEQLLRETTLPINLVANRVGYENPSHFIRQFRSSHGQTPAAYRNSSS